MGWLGRRTRKPGELTHSEAAEIIGCSGTTVGDLLRLSKLIDLKPETVTLFARTYQRGKAGRPTQTIVLPDGREVRGWETASALLDCNRATLRKRSDWHDGRFVIRPSNRKKSA